MTKFSCWKIRLRRLQIITLDKLIKKERLERFNRFKDQNTRQDSLYQCISWYQSVCGLRLTLVINHWTCTCPCATRSRQAGYQITQQRRPLAVGGCVSYLVPPATPGEQGGGTTRREARITQLQLEQDSGKSLHDTDGQLSLIDLNRAGQTRTAAQAHHRPL